MTLEYKTFGNSKQQSIVLIHPFPFNSSLWQIVAQDLSKNFYVITPDLPGCGASPQVPKETPSMNFLAQEIQLMLSSLDISKPVIAGISLGGYVAMEFMRLYPHNASGFILVDTKASADTSVAKENRFKVAKQMRDSGKVELFAEQMLPNLVGEYTHSNRHDVINIVKKWMLESKPESIAWLQEAMAGRTESFQVLSAIDVPCLLIRGDQDLISSAKDFEMMQKYLQKVTFVEIKNAGHLPPIEDPIQTAKVISEWLTKFI